MAHHTAKMLRHLLTIGPFVSVTGTDALAELLGAAMDRFSELG